MLGAIIGDIVGSRFEFKPTNDYDFDLFHSDCSVTDDSVCTCAIADAILHRKSYEDALREWGRKYPIVQGGYGGMFHRWLHSSNPTPYNSYGNGSAMRVSPVGFLFSSFGIVSNEACKSAMCTHNHPEGIKGAKATAQAIYMARTGYNKLEIVKHLCDLHGYSIDFDLQSVMNYHDITCQGTMPVALRCINDSYSFEDTLRNAIALGVDADTIGAIVGGIAEALYGIPTNIIMDSLPYIPDDMRKIIKEVYSKIPNLEYICDLMN